MKILVTGNMGYVGPGVIKKLREVNKGAEIIGFDMGYFAHCLTNVEHLPEVGADKQYFGDIREFPYEILDDIDAIVNLAAISNDPMGKKFEDITLDVNYKSGVKLAEEAKKRGVKTFVFASSCSVYGAADDNAKIETDTLNPLTAYAKSKVNTEKDLEPLADDSFKVTCFRFATACGMSNRLRLDLVLNDFVAGAIINKEINILSDGSPWRPLINVLDMARAIDWGVSRDKENGGNFVSVNAGSNEWNYQVKELAETVAEIIPGVSVSVNPEAPPDKRSYKVNFDKFKELAPNHQPIHDLKKTIRDLADGLSKMGFSDNNFRESSLIRLKVLDALQNNDSIDGNLVWNFKK